MEKLKQEDLVETPPTSDGAAAEETVETPDEDPLKKELERVQSSGRTEAEKAEHQLRENAKRARKLGIDPATVLGIKPETSDDDEDDKPVTRRDLKEMISANAAKTALQLADEISDTTERALVKHQLENVVIASGNPQEDLRTARRIVNSIKNEQIAAEIARKGTPKTHSSAGGSPATETAPEVPLTPAELQFMKPPFNMTKVQIIKARPS